MTHEITTQQLSQFALFKSIAEEALLDLTPHCNSVTIQAGEVLFEQDDPAKHLYLIEEGEITLIRRYEGGDEVVLATIGPYGVIGELSMITGESRTAAGIALSDARLIMLHHDALFKYLHQFPSVAMELMVEIAQRLRQNTLMVREWAMENAEARLAGLILFLAEEDGEIQTGLISSNLRLRNLARASGVDMNWLHETLDEWAFDGYIGIDGRRFLLHDVAALKAIAGW
ncbi:MAG: Crp/Fnr family transcriptional regulator [Chloroflexi bacterium]|nr:Crp/Fnr family transcriptional regulator [Chloroflexota bacterium]